MLLSPRDVLEQARDLLTKGEVKNAASILWTMLRIETIPQEDFVDGTFLLGSAYSILNRHDDAVSVLEVTLECDPEHFMAMSSLGYAELAQGNPNLAEEWFRKSIAIESKNSWALKNLGICLTNQRRFADAQVELRRCLVLTPDDIGVLVDLGQCLHHLGDLTGAKGAIRASTNSRWPRSPTKHGPRLSGQVRKGCREN